MNENIEAAKIIQEGLFAIADAIKSTNNSRSIDNIGNSIQAFDRDLMNFLINNLSIKK